MKYLNYFALMVVSVFLLFSCAGNSNADTRYFDYDLDETYPINKDGILTLYSEDAEVQITGSDRKDVHLVVWKRLTISGTFEIMEKDSFSFDVEETDGNLFIRENSGGISMSGSIYMREEYTITIDAPSGISLKLRGSDDTYSVNNIDGYISMRLDDGNAKIRDCDGDKFSLEVDDGELEMIGGNGQLDAFICDGKMKFDRGNFSSIEAACDDGELEIITSLSRDGSYRLDAEDGKIIFNVLDGGGDFIVHYEDGKARASKNYEAVDKDEGFRHWRLPGGKASVRASLSDGSINFYGGK